MDSSPASIEVSSKLAYLQPGMYLVRLMDGALGNVLMLSATPVGRGTLDFFPGDGVLRNTLAKVGDCIVVRVNVALGSLLLTEFHKPGQQQRITVKIDHVAQENFQAAISGQGAQTVAGTEVDAASGPVVRMLGHIERVGDTVSQDDWLGDPTLDRRIEGFAAGLLGLSNRVSLKYSAQTAGTRKFSKAVAGEFVGTRQQAKALTGVMFELSGPDAKKFQLSGQVVFLGQAPLTIKPGVEMTGSTGKEPLTALRLIVTPKEPRKTAAEASTIASTWDNPAITKIKRLAPAKPQVPASKQKSSVAASPKAAAKKVVAHKAAASKAPAKKVAAKNAPAKKVVAKKAPAKKVAAKKVLRKGARK